MPLFTWSPVGCLPQRPGISTTAYSPWQTMGIPFWLFLPFCSIPSNGVRTWHQWASVKEAVFLASVVSQSVYEERMRPSGLSWFFCANQGEDDNEVVHVGMELSGAQNWRVAFCVNCCCSVFWAAICSANSRAGPAGRSCGSSSQISVCFSTSLTR